MNIQTSQQPVLDQGSGAGLLATAHTLGQQFAARAAENDEQDRFVAENYAALKAQGLVTAGVPRELGGGGATIPELAEMLRILAHHCSSTALAFAMHTHQVAIPAWRWSTQKVAAVEPLLKRIAAERLVLLSSGGSDWIAGSGRAERVEGGWCISARKVFTSGAPAGDLLMTSAIAEQEGEEPMVLHFGIPMTSPHVRIDPVWKSLGMRGTGSHDVVIDGHVVPDAAVALKRKAGEWHPLFQIISTIAFPLVCSAYLGVAESACAIALSLARKRRPDHNLLQLLGRMQTELKGAELARGMMLEATRHGHCDAETVNEVMTGKTLMAQHALNAVALAMEAAGGAGFYRAPGLERRFRDMQGIRYHPLQSGPQADYAGSMALGLPVAKIF
jgi:alkylation response protein AidB-like acyl-CoA dehydrogenase